jgi:hypothetical protein
MAGDWLKIEACTPDKPEVIGIADMLGIPPAHAFGCLFLVWRWFDQHTTSGNASFVTKVTVDRLSGNAGFADSMEKVGWLHIDDDGSVTLPHFDTHNGETAKQRGLTAKRVAKSKAKSNAEGNGMVTEEALPKEEKRREEKSNTTTGDITFEQFLEDCKTKNEKPIPEDDSIYAWAEKVKMPDSVLIVLWQAFKRKEWKDAKGKPKKYKDWRKTFRNYCEKPDWLKVYSINREGEYYLTPSGKLLEREANWSAI